MFTKTAGFTLIELLVVIAVIGALAGALIVLINPTSALDKSRLAKAKNFQGQLTHGALEYYNVGAWNFNDSSNQAADISGNNNTGTLNGGISYIANCDLGLGGCFSFDGVDDYLNIGNAPQLNFGSGNFSISFWQYRTDNSSVKLVLGKRAYPAGYVLYYSGDILYVQLGNGTTATAYNVGTLSTLNTWQLITIVVNRSTNELLYYLDGNLIRNTSISGFTGSIDNAGYFGIGRDQSDNRSFQGKLDEIYVFNQSLSQAMIQKYFASSARRHFLASLL